MSRLNIPNLSVSLSLCPVCQSPMFMTVTDTGEPGSKWHTTECPRCGFTSSVVVEVQHPDAKGIEPALK